MVNLLSKARDRDWGLKNECMQERLRGLSQGLFPYPGSRQFQLWEDEQDWLDTSGGAMPRDRTSANWPATDDPVEDEHQGSNPPVPIYKSTSGLSFGDPDDADPMDIDEED
jgi:hypothetical protein